MSTSESTCRNHSQCEGCALALCCPVKLEVVLQTLKRQRESARLRMAGLTVDILGFDQHTESKTRPG